MKAHAETAAPHRLPVASVPCRPGPPLRATVVQRVRGSPRPQATLTVGAPNDAFEREADHVADRVMRMPEPGVQRMCRDCGDEFEGEQVVRRLCRDCEEKRQATSDAGGTGPAPHGFASSLAALQGGGRPLSGADRAFFEPRFGRDFSAVRLHSGPAASELARSVNARAFTLGNAIVLGDGEGGRHLLAHELTHVVQQGGRAHRVQRRGPMPRRAVRPPRARLGIPTRGDNSFEAMLERAALRNHAERIRIEQERPIATLARGGEAPGFITVERTRRYSWLGGPGGGGSVDVRDRRFHILDAIEHAVSRANNDADLERILDAYVPGVGVAFRAIALLRGRPRTASPAGIRLTAFWDDPLIPDDFDPAAEQRLEVFEQALRRRARTVPDLAGSALLPQTRRRRGCRLVPTDPSGDDPLSNLYCHMATGSPYSYRIYIESDAGAATRRWAEIDALRGNTWYECKCGYEALLSGAARGEGVARAVLERLDHQVLNHQHIARECGLEYRYIVSNDRVADTLRSRWFGNVVIDVVRFEPCD